MNPAAFLQRFGAGQPNVGQRYGVDTDTSMDYGQMPTQDTTGRNSSGRPSDMSNAKPTPPTNMAAG